MINKIITTTTKLKAFQVNIKDIYLKASIFFDAKWLQEKQRIKTAYF